MLGDQPAQQGIILPPDPQLGPETLHVRAPKQLPGSPPPPRTAQRPPGQDRHRQVEPHDRIDVRPYDAPGESPVGARDDPSFAPGRPADPPLELLGVRLVQADPVRKPVQLVQLDERCIQRLCNLRASVLLPDATLPVTWMRLPVGDRGINCPRYARAFPASGSRRPARRVVRSRLRETCRTFRRAVGSRSRARAGSRRSRRGKKHR